MKYGNLLSYLEKYKKGLITNHKALLNICTQVSSGMAYLESMQFIHRDLAARNCLVGSGGVVKVSDFGMSKFMTTDNYQGQSHSVIPMSSVPPEVISRRMFSSKSDVWAFGLLMWEVFTCGDKPFGSLMPMEVGKLVEKGYILDHPKAATAEDYDVSGEGGVGDQNSNILSVLIDLSFLQIMTRCWAYTPEKRPSFARLDAIFHAMVKC